MAKPKRLSRQAVLGQKGINVVEKLVLDMGSRWTPSGPNEVGIDGYIELFDPNSGEALGKNVAVQSKAVSRLQQETEEGFRYSCSRRDIDYWLQGNMPVILVVSRPDHGDAYWVAVKDYFGDGEARVSSTVHFNKKRNRLSKDSFHALARSGRSPREGLYLAPVPRKERIFSNLLELTRHPATIWVGRTHLRYAGQIWSALRESKGEVPGSWLLRSHAVMSFTNLAEHPWGEVCDLGTVEEFATSEWSQASDPVRQREFVELLNRTLAMQLFPEVRYWDREGCFAVWGTIKAGTLKRTYSSLRRKSRIAIITKYEKEIAEGRRFEWLRHLAFRGHFRRLENTWYLEITPTYRFTKDGVTLDRFHESRLKGIKRLEGNRAVLSSVLYWADYLSSFSALFEAPPLTFGPLRSFEATVGLSDELWSASDEHAPGVKEEDSEDQLSLLDSSEGFQE